MSGGLTAFPFKRAYLPPPEQYFERLRSRTYVAVTDTPYVARMRAAFQRGKGRAGLVQTPWGFDRKEISFVVGDAAFDDVDLITDHFTEEARMAANVRGHPSPLAAWRDPAVAQKVAGSAAVRARRAGVAAPSTYMLREACYDAVPECTLFKVSLAAEIYRFFCAAGPGRPPKVLDPFAGWGDRALGAAGAGVSYVGVDPNPALVPGYAAIRDFLARVSPETSTRFRSIPFEAYGPAELSEDFPGGTGPAGADLVFSSPPFYDYEVYSADPRQSFVAATEGAAGRNPSLAEWLSSWFLPATDRAWGALKPGGCLAYYLSDELGEVTTPLCDHMEALGRQFRGVIACRRGEKRPLPLWVWQKGGAEPVAVLPAVAAPSLDSYVYNLLTGTYAEI